MKPLLPHQRTLPPGQTNLIPVVTTKQDQVSIGEVQLLPTAGCFHGNGLSITCHFYSNDLSTPSAIS